MLLLPPQNPCPATRAAGGLTADELDRLDALLIMVPHAHAARVLKDLPRTAPVVAQLNARTRGVGEVFDAVLARGSATRVVVGLLGEEATTFQRLTLAGRMVRLAAGVAPEVIGLHAPGQGATACEPLLCAVRAATEAQPSAKSAAGRGWVPRRVRVYDAGGSDIARVDALESGAHLARWLTALPPDLLDPAGYRERLARLARRHGWRMQVFGERALARLGAHAFLAVARGSAQRDAAIIKLEYRPRRSVKARRPEAPVALVGKGICFDTGGTNLKNAAGMHDMHTDMAGSAVVVGVLEGLTRLDYPRPLDAWLAIADNRCGPAAYTQAEVVRALNGVTIQVAHTDAEGRMALADTLALAARERPTAIIDFATLTGACVNALTERMSGVFTNRAALRDALELAGHRSGERVHVFPSPADLDEDLDTPFADVAQCLIDGKGDHLYAARFLNRFVPPAIPWAHVDLSSATRKGGLGHVSRDITGFGVRYCATLLLDDYAALKAAGARP